MNYKTHPNYKLILGLVFLTLFIKELVYVITIPPWQNHDEGAHFAYTQYLIEEKKLPIYQGFFKSPVELSFSEEYGESELTVLTKKYGGFYQPYQPELFSFASVKKSLLNLSRHPLTKSASPSDYLNLYYKLPEENQYKNSAAIYPPLYYLVESIPYLLFYHQDIITRMYAMRIFSIIFYLLTIYFSYKIAENLTRSFSFSLTLALIIGFQPSFSFVAAGINNDALLTFLATLTIYLCLKIFDRFNLKNSVLLGIILGLGLLTKHQFVVFPFLATIPFLYHYFKKYEQRKKIIKYFFITFIIMFLIAGWWFVRNYYLYNNIISPSTIPRINEAFLHLPFGTYLYIIVKRLIYLFTTFSFSISYNVGLNLPLIFIWLGTILTILAGFGFFYWFMVKRKVMEKIFRLKTLFLILSIVLIEVFYFALFMKSLIQHGVFRFPVDGRYFFPVISSILLIWLAGLTFFLPKNYKKIVYFVLTIVMMASNVVFLSHVILPLFYL